MFTNYQKISDSRLQVEILFELVNCKFISQCFYIQTIIILKTPKLSLICGVCTQIYNSQGLLFQNNSFRLIQIWEENSYFGFLVISKGQLKKPTVSKVYSISFFVVIKLFYAKSNQIPSLFFLHKVWQIDLFEQYIFKLN